MKVNIELEIPEADIIFKALKIVDPTNIFCGNIKKKLAEAAKPVIEAEKEKKDK